MSERNPSGKLATAARTPVEERLHRAGIASVEVGRWRAADGDHVALLTADRDAVAARAAARAIAGTRVHVLTTSGSRSGSFRLDNPQYSSITIAIFPFDLAGALLDRSSQDGGLGALDRFHIAAYVAAYFRSCERLVGLEDGPGHVPLERLAQAADVDPAICRDRAAIDAHLAGIGWRPSIDMLERLSLADVWIERDLLPGLIGDQQVEPGLAIFFCRTMAVELGFTPVMRTAIEDAGFEILKSLPLDARLINEIRSATRGGNWGAGPFPKGGGPPVHLLFAIDVFPSSPDPLLLRQHPFLDNSRTLEAKFAARDAVFRALPKAERFNPLHSSDNSTEAMRIASGVLSAADLAEVSEVFAVRMAEIAARRGSAEPLAGRKRTAAHFWVGQGADRRLRKIYRPQYAEDVERAVDLQSTLAGHWPEFPAVAARGAGYVDFDLNADAFAPLAEHSLPARVSTVLRLRKILRAVARTGYQPERWDLDHGLFFSAARAEIRIPLIDRVTRTEKPRRLSDIVPRDRHSSSLDDYRVSWHPIIGLPRWVFLNGGPVTMYLYRSLFFHIHTETVRLGGVARSAVWRRIKSLGTRRPWRR